MTGAILTLNVGSSSLKFAIFDAAGPTGAARLQGKIAGIGRDPLFTARGAEGAPETVHVASMLTPESSHEDAAALLLDWLAEHHDVQPLSAVGHRVVHGGAGFSGPTRITGSILEDLEALVPLAPLHQPHNIAAIRVVAKRQPDLPQIACFDTGFHRTQDRLATLFALPSTLTDEGIVRYGFHGLSYDFISGVLPEHLGPRADGRVIVAHLGNGSSMCAMKKRKSVATSMGFTALDGLVMGRRSGSLDPGVILYLMQTKGMDAAAIETLLYRQSGLLGISGISNNMEVLEASEDPNAREAIDLYAYRAASILAGLVPAIGGLDALIFTAGIGEHSACVRQRICGQLAWLGIEVDRAANENSAVTISSEASAVKVLVIPTNEEAVILAGCRNVLGSEDIPTSINTQGGQG